VRLPLHHRRHNVHRNRLRPLGPRHPRPLPRRDATRLYIANRHQQDRRPTHGKGSVTVLDFNTNKITATWPIPGGGSPDIGNVSADGKTLWLSGRYDNVVYAINTTTGAVTRIPVGTEPHGLSVWPQPGRYSLGHTGNMR
jgi:DNA-binding beta-propeller fold protein YncE